MSLDKIKIQKTAQNLINHFDDKAEIVCEIKDEIWQISIESEISPILIGRHGQTLEALEYLLRLLVAREAEEFIPLNLDISGYKASREREITEMAKEIAQKVLDSSSEEVLPPMNGYERRLVHLALSEIEGIETESVGEEPYRQIIIKIRNPKSEI